MTTKIKHTFFTYGYNGFFNGNKESLPTLFAQLEYEKYLESQDKDPYLKSCLYKKVGKNKMSFVPGLVRSLTRIVFSEENEPGFGGFGFDSEQNFWFDYYDGSKEDFLTGKYGEHRHILMKLDSEGQMSAVCVDEFGGEKPYVITTRPRQPESHSSSAACALLMAYFYHKNKCGFTQTPAEEVMAAHITDAVEAYRDCDEEKLAKAAICASNDIYAYIAFADNVAGSLNVNDYDNPIIANLKRPSNIAFDSFTGNSIYFDGSAKKAKASSLSAKKIAKKVKDFIGEFVLNEKRILSDEEAELVPDCGEMQLDEETLTKAKLIKGSTLLPKPFRNVKWVGETGTGKSTASQHLAQLLNLPYVFMTFNPDTIVSDLYVNILPSNKKSDVDIKEMSSILELAVFNPEEAYEKLTGESKKAGTADVLKKVIEKSLENTSDFMYVESPLVQAYRYGYLCELQETNLASKPGVLGGINAALDDIGIIQLPTGEVIKRHPDCVIVMTENIGYEGTRKSNQAVDSRMTLKGVFELPEESELAERISANSGLKDMDTIKKMIKVMYAIRRVREENGETDGACSVREVQSWAAATDILKDPYEAALSTIIPSAYRDEELRPDIIAALETQFSPR